VVCVLDRHPAGSVLFCHLHSDRVGFGPDDQAEAVIAVDSRRGGRADHLADVRPRVDLARLEQGEVSVEPCDAVAVDAAVISEDENLGRQLGLLWDAAAVYEDIAGELLQPIHGDQHCLALARAGLDRRTISGGRRLVARRAAGRRSEGEARAGKQGACRSEGQLTRARSFHQGRPKPPSQAADAAAQTRLHLAAGTDKR